MQNYAREKKCEKWSKLGRIMADIAESDISPKLMPRLKEKIKSYSNNERLLNELAASLPLKK